MIASILSFLSSVAGLLSRVLDFLRDKRNYDAGRKEAIFEREQKVIDKLKQAADQADKSNKQHVSDETDDAFDKDFWRD